MPNFATNGCNKSDGFRYAEPNDVTSLTTVWLLPMLSKSTKGSTVSRDSQTLNGREIRKLSRFTLGNREVPAACRATVSEPCLSSGCASGGVSLKTKFGCIG